MMSKFLPLEVRQEVEHRITGARLDPVLDLLAAGKLPSGELDQLIEAVRVSLQIGLEPIDGHEWRGRRRIAWLNSCG